MSARARPLFLPPGLAVPFVAPGRRPRVLRHNLQLCTWDAVLASPIVWLSAGGNFVMAALLTEHFGVDKALFGWICALPAIFNALQMVATPLLLRWMSLKHMTLGFAWVHLALWVVLAGALPYFPTDDLSVVGPLLLLIFGAQAAVAAVAGVGWTSWIQEWIPARLRGKYFGGRNQLAALSTLAFLLVAGWLTDQAGGGVLAYQLVIVPTILLRAWALHLQGLVLQPEQAGRPAPPLPPNQLREVLRNRPFMAFVVFSAAINFVLSSGGPFFVPFMYEELKISAGGVATLVMVASIGGFLGNPIWGRLCDRYGCRPVIFVSLWLWTLPDFFWPFAQPETAWVLHFMWFSGGLMSVGFFMGCFNLVLKLIDPATKTTAVSLNLAATSTVAALGPILFGALLEGLRSSGADVSFGWRAAIFARLLLVLGTSFLLLRVAEPAAARVTDVLGGFRTVRQVVAAQGAAILSNLSPVRGRRRR